MSDAEQTEGSESTETQGEDTPTKADREAAGILEALKAEREKRQAMQAELESFKREREESERKRLEEQGEWKTLAEQRAAELERVKSEHEALSQREQERIARVAERNGERLKAIPEALRATVEVLPEGTSPDVISSMLDRLEKAAVATGQAHGSQVKPGGTSGEGLSKAEMSFKDRRPDLRTAPDATVKAVFKAQQTTMGRA